MKQFDLFLCFILLSFLAASSGCSQSGRRLPINDNDSTIEGRQPVISSGDRTVIKMEKENGVRYVWIEINGIRLKVVFDTGASNLCISSAEASVLYRQGTLKKEDIMDVLYFQDASGNISEGTRINIRKVKVGNRVLENIEAIVIDNNEAPLLLGQSVLEKFGKISIDNTKGEIVLE